MFIKYVNTFLCVLYSISCVCCDLDLPEGAACEVDGANGTCFNIFNCMSTVADMKHKKHPKICSFQGREPVVCCTDCEKVNDTRTVVIDTGGGVFFKTGQKARDHCIELASCLPYTCGSSGLMKFQDRQLGCFNYEPSFGTVVVGGNDAERFKYPHMALLGFGPDLESVQWLCGGSLISSDFVLTAGHCISGPNIGPVTYVALGILKRTDSPELWQRHRVLRVIPHPQYRPPSKYHDIALLRIEPVKKYSTAVFPACLDFDASRATVVWATGWGALGKNRTLADTLQQVSLSEFEEEECMKQYPEHRHLKRGYDHTTQRCYGDTRETKDTCEGDSGGPIQITSSISKCMWNIVGLTSSGRACGYKSGDSGLYTRISRYLPWIESVVWP